MLEAVKKFLEKKRKEIERIQSVVYEEQKVLMKKQLEHAKVMCKACKLSRKDCKGEDVNIPASGDTFFFLQQLVEEGVISREYARILRKNLLTLFPELEKEARNYFI